MFKAGDWSNSSVFAFLNVNRQYLAVAHMSWNVIFIVVTPGVFMQEEVQIIALKL